MTEDRLRTPPVERFAGTKHLFSLAEALAELRAEDHPSRNGHRQITLFHRGPVYEVLFSFDPGGYLEEHAAPGVVTIHVLEGHLSVAAEGEDRKMKEGDVLILDPDVPHDVRSKHGAAMLLTVHLEREEE